MFRQSSSAVFLAFSLLSSAFCVPMSELRIKRQSSSSTDSPNGTTRDSDDITITSNNVQLSNEQLNNEQINNEVAADDAVDDEDDAFASYPDDNTSGGGGSNLFSLLGLVTSFLPGSSSSASIQKLLREIVKRNLPKVIIRRGAININEIDTNYIAGLNPPPLLRQENESNNNIETEDNGSNESSGSVESLEDEENKNNSNQDLDTNEDSDYDEPPGGGDGEGGGLLGLLAGLSGDEDGQSDLGSLLATIGGIVANLSGDGIDLNSLIASGIGLFVGLLSEGEQNPGEIIASYLLTSLDTITGGGAKNNGAFFGKFLSKLVKGTSAALDPDADSEEGGNEMQSKDSAGFFVSFIMGLLGDMSKGSSGSHP